MIVLTHQMLRFRPMVSEEIALRTEAITISPSLFIKSDGIMTLITIKLAYKRHVNAFSLKFQNAHFSYDANSQAQF